MSESDRPGAALDRPSKRRAGATRFAFGDRLARTFGGFDRTREELPTWEPRGEPEYEADGEPELPWMDSDERFPLVRHGYDCVAVDGYLAELEHELDGLRRRGTPANAVEAEIKEIGERTAAILRVAHEQANETTRRAQTEADRCLADAAANAVAMTEEAKRKLRDLDNDTDSVWRERARMIDDARQLAAALSTLADNAASRFPAEPEPVSRPPLRASEPESLVPPALRVPDAERAEVRDARVPEGVLDQEMLPVSRWGSNDTSPA
jgi:hypothetical protein